jgi:hypothetical protein
MDTSRTMSFVPSDSSAPVPDIIDIHESSLNTDKKNNNDIFVTPASTSTFPAVWPSAPEAPATTGRTNSVSFSDSADVDDHAPSGRSLSHAIF